MRRATKSATNLSKHASNNGIAQGTIFFVVGIFVRNLIFMFCTAVGRIKHDSAESTTNSNSDHQQIRESIMMNSTAKLLFANSLTNPHKHLGILKLKVCIQPFLGLASDIVKNYFSLQAGHYGLLAHPAIVADRQQHYNMARSMAALSLSFIILMTPWTMKEVAISCIGTKVYLFKVHTI